VQLTGGAAGRIRAASQGSARSRIGGRGAADGRYQTVLVLERGASPVAGTSMTR